MFSDIIDLIRFPVPRRAPLVAILRRVGAAIALIIFVALVVRLGGDGFVDVTGEPIGFLDAVYYASVTVTTPDMATSPRSAREPGSQRSC